MKNSSQVLSESNADRQSVLESMRNERVVNEFQSILRSESLKEIHSPITNLAIPNFTVPLYKLTTSYFLECGKTN